MKCTPDSPHDSVQAALALCEGCGRPLVILRQHGGAGDGTTLTAVLSDDGLVGLLVGAVGLAGVLGLSEKLNAALQNPGGTVRLEDRLEEP